MTDKFPCLLISFFLCATGCLHQPKSAPSGKSAGVSSPNESDTKIVHSDWLYWRGPNGMGVSDQTGLPDDLNQSLLWTHEIQGGGVPVIAGGRAYQFGYYGVEDDLQEALVCFDAATGKVLWERRHSDFVSDIVYNRYGVGAACIDPASGNVYFQTSPGLLIGYDSEGNQLWERSLMEEFARLTFPNGRTGGPCVDGNLVIIHA